MKNSLYKFLKKDKKAKGRNMTQSFTVDDFYEAHDRVLTGIKRKLPLTEKDRKVIAYHEAGHAITGWFSKNALPILKVSIVPRSKGALGFTISKPKEVELYSKEQLQDLTSIMYGGRVSEELFIGTITTGAKDDLQKIMGLARQYVGSFGMSESFINIGIFDQTNPFVFEQKMLSSSSTAKKMDNEIRKFCHQIYENTKHILETHSEDVKKLANMLLEKEVVELDELAALLGPPAYENKDELLEYIDDLKKKRESTTQPQAIHHPNL